MRDKARIKEKIALLSEIYGNVNLKNTEKGDNLRDKQQDNRRRKERYERLKAEGICTRCGQAPARPGKTECAECAKLQSDTREFYHRLGFCSVCRRERVYGAERVCPECRAKRAISKQKSIAKAKEEGKEWASREYANSMGVERYHARKNKGVCPVCGKRPLAPGRAKCQICLCKQAENARRYRVKAEIRGVV